jgi:hypothetical protein
VKDGGVQVVQMDAAANRLEPEFVGRSVLKTSADATPS